MPLLLERLAYLLSEKCRSYLAAIGLILRKFLCEMNGLLYFHLRRHGRLELVNHYFYERGLV